MLKYRQVMLPAITGQPQTTQVPAAQASAPSKPQVVRLTTPTPLPVIARLMARHVRKLCCILGDTTLPTIRTRLA
jgi:hypothetical protein